MRCRRVSMLSVFSAVLLAHLATPTALPWGDIRVMHTWNSVPDNWESLGPPPAGTTIDLHIALKPQHENALIDALDEVSSPGHPKYGAHLSKEQVAELVAPHQNTLMVVHSWLEHHGVPSASISTSQGGGWLTITGVPVSQADKLLGASYQLYRHTGTNETETILRTVGYALPAALHSHVDTIAPTTHFASPRTLPQTPREHSSEEAAVVVNATSKELVGVLTPPPSNIVSPSMLRWLYKTEAYVPAAMNENALGTLGLLNHLPSQNDLTQFMSNFRVDAEAATFTLLHLNGGGQNMISGADGSLQLQYAEAIAYPTPHIFYDMGGGLKQTPSGTPAAGDAYLEWFNYLFTHENIPPTIGIAYANPEPEFPMAYAKGLCRLFAQLGARGASVLVASGNDGVGRGDCLNEAGFIRFIPMFPASCPWVTSVGGTTGQEPEVAAVFSGGGFSTYFHRHSCQNDAVTGFIRSFGNQYSARYSRVGRGIPDISAQAQRYIYVRDNVATTMSGTICATSTAAGIVSLLNDYRLSKNMKPLGFLNTWLYSHGLITLNDIASGSNPGCNTDGFRAIEGWDPVTGLGTLDFEILQHVIDLDD